MTYREAIVSGEKSLCEAGIADARNDAWLLLTMACKIDHTYYYMHIDEEMPEELQHEFEVLIKKRAERVPLQYITGEQEFMGMTFHVNSNVLIPRQDTETLVEEALKVVKPGMKVLDMCTGSGCVLISILKNVHGTGGYGYDISKQAINVAKENAKLNDVPAIFERSNLFEDVADETFDVITDHFKMNTKTRETYLDNQLIEGLTPKEFDLLYTLAKKPRQVFSREQLLELVWDYQYFGDERTVDAHIKKLRQKIEKVGPQVIQTVWGVGYKFDDSGVA